MFSCGSSGSKLHAIYVALDSHQYNRAIKLASQNKTPIGQALLAHAYAKAQQRDKCLIVLEGLLGRDVLGADNCIQQQQQQQKEVTVTTTKGKKGKGGGHPKQQQQPAPTAPPSLEPDWIAKLDQQAVDPLEHLDKDDVTIADPSILQDETTVETIAFTLTGLRLYVPLYRLYNIWAAAAATSAEMKLKALAKQFLTGLHLLLLPTNTNQSTNLLLASLQVIALQLARFDSSKTAWAAQTALWQIEQHHNNQSNVDNNNNDAKMQQRLAMLPRLAESLAQKQLASHPTAEHCQLYLLSLEIQNKHVEMYHVLQEWEAEEDSKNALSKIQVMEHQLTACCNDNDDKLDVYRKLLELQPDQWSYWKGLVQHVCSHELPMSVVEEIMAKHEGQHTSPLRSLELCKCEIMSNNPTKLLEAVQEYAQRSAASCTFSDVSSYIDALLETPEMAKPLVEWAKSCCYGSQQQQPKLKTCIFGLELLLHIRKQHDTVVVDSSDLLDWRRLYKMYQDYPAAGATLQKESQPADDLLLLAIQCMDLLSNNNHTTSSLRLTAAYMLEMALQKSPYNPHLKICLLQIYSLLGAARPCWRLFQELEIKHIQLESCALHLIVPCLVQGALYPEAILVCNELLRHHVSTRKDSGDYMGRAMEAGTFSKANDFMTFQKERMTPSLSLLEAKSVVMNCAPLLPEAKHGIQGDKDNDDLERATQMLEQLDNFHGAPNIMKMSLSLEYYSDNRDLDMLAFSSLACSKDEIVEAALECGRIHGALLRAVLVMDATKGPKKGKVVAASEALKTKAQSLLTVVADLNSSDNGWITMFQTLCQILVVVSSGLPLNNDEKVEHDDTLATREERATQLLQSIQESSIPSCCSSLSEMALLLPRYLHSNIVVLKLVAKLFGLFGWGKRKQRVSTTTLAAVASKLDADVVQKMLDALDKDKDKDISMQAPSSEVEVLDEAVCKQVQEQVRQSRQETWSKLESLLVTYHNFLVSFRET